MFSHMYLSVGGRSHVNFPQDALGCSTVVCKSIMGQVTWDPPPELDRLCLKENTADYVSRRTWVPPPPSWTVGQTDYVSRRTRLTISQGGHGYPPPPQKWWKRTPPSPQKWWWKRTPHPPRSGGGRGLLPKSVCGRGPHPTPQGKDQTRPAEKYCWASGRYALEKRLSCVSNFPVQAWVICNKICCFPKKVQGLSEEETFMTH